MGGGGSCRREEVVGGGSLGKAEVPVQGGGSCMGEGRARGRHVPGVY